MEDKIVNIKTIPKDGVITLEVSGEFYNRIRSYISHLGDIYGEDKLGKIYRYIEDGMSHHDQTAFNFETLLILCKSIEEEFHNNDLMLDEEINITQTIKDLEAEADEESKTED